MADSGERVFGPYRLLDKIGDGGMAEVYRAYDTRTGKLVALKLLLPHLWRDGGSLERFRREARHAAGLRHPHIVPVYESGVVEGRPYLALAYVDGGSLADQLAWQQGPLPLGRAAEVLHHVALALDYAHGRGLVHRDVKPSNVLLARDGRALLADFGIARAVWESRLTQTGERMGTPFYMAPEQIRAQAVDWRADIYGLGVVLYEMTTGRVPFQGGWEVVLYHHLHEPPPAPRQLNPALPPAAEGAILRALAKSPERRYQTAGELATAFRRAVGAATPPGVAKPRGRGRRATPDARRGATPSKRAPLPPALLVLGATIGAMMLVAVMALVIGKAAVGRLPLATRTPRPGVTVEVAVGGSPTLPSGEPVWNLDGPEVVQEDQEVVLSWQWRDLEEPERFVFAIWKTQETLGQAVFTATVGLGEPPKLTFTPQERGLPPGDYQWAVHVGKEIDGVWEMQIATQPRSLSVAPRPTDTPTPKPTPTPVVPKKPELVEPAQGLEYANPVTFKWLGLLKPGQAYQIKVWYMVGGSMDPDSVIESDLLMDQDWQRGLPDKKAGEWRWTVSVVQGGQVVMTSEEGMFWFQPFAGVNGDGNGDGNGECQQPTGDCPGTWMLIDSETCEWECMPPTRPED